MSIASTLAAGYHSDIVQRFVNAPEQTVLPYHRTIEYAPAIRALKQAGYQYYSIGSPYGATNRAPMADAYIHGESQLTVLGRPHTMGAFEKGYMEKTFFYRFLQQGLKIGDTQVYQASDRPGSANIEFQLDMLEKTAKEPAGGRFVFAHLLIPHDPFFFNADGSYAPHIGTDDTGSRVEDKYLKQIEFINAKLQELFATVKEQSADKAVVILQADEGPYPVYFLDRTFDPVKSGSVVMHSDMRSWSQQALQMKMGILAAYHMPGVRPELIQEQGTPANIFRIVLNEYLGYRLPYLPACHFGYADGRSRANAYTEITDKITGQPPQAGCAEVHSR